MKANDKPSQSKRNDNTFNQEGQSTHPKAVGMPEAAELPVEFGRYRLTKLLGQGGMGAVYLAHDTELGRDVALKLPHFTGNRTKDLSERFRREARLAATLNHPNICRIHDINEQDGQLYLTMEFVEGKSLHEVIRAKGGVDSRTAAKLVGRLASAVHFAHSKGIIHRDLKPANIMIKKDREFVVMDFGLARRIEQEEVQLTATGAVLGTPAYMAPEQLRGENKNIGAQSDVYSLGVILYELLTGERPFQGTLPQIYAQVLSSDSVSPRTLKANVDPDLDAICQRATSSDQNQRYRTAEDFAKALNDYLSGQTQRPSNALDSLPSLAEMQVPMASFPAVAIKKPAVSKSKLPVIAIGSVVGLAVVVAMAALLFRGSSSSQAAKSNESLAGANATEANPKSQPASEPKAEVKQSNVPVKPNNTAENRAAVDTESALENSRSVSRRELGFDAWELYDLQKRGEYGEKNVNLRINGVIEFNSGMREICLLSKDAFALGSLKLEFQSDGAGGPMVGVGAKIKNRAGSDFFDIYPFCIENKLNDGLLVLPRQDFRFQLAPQQSYESGDKRKLAPLTKWLIQRGEWHTLECALEGKDYVLRLDNSIINRLNAAETIEGHVAIWPGTCNLRVRNVVVISLSQSGPSQAVVKANPVTDSTKPSTVAIRPTPDDYLRMPPGLIWSTKPSDTWWWCASISPRGDYLAAMEDNRDPKARAERKELNIRVWPIRNGQKGQDSFVLSQPGGTTYLSAMSFSSDGSLLATATTLGSIVLWDMNASTPKQLANLKRFDGVITALGISPDGRYLAAGERIDGNPVIVWDLQNAQEPRELHTWDMPAPQAPSSLVFTHDSHGLFIGGGGVEAQNARLYRWDFLQSREASEIWKSPDWQPGEKRLGPWIRNLALSGDGSRIAIAHNTSAYVVDTRTGQTLQTFSKHVKPVQGICFAHNDSACLTASYDQTMRLWDVASGEQLWQNESETGANEGLAVSRDGKIAFTTSHSSAPQQTAKSLNGNVAQLWRLPDDLKSDPKLSSSETPQQRDDLSALQGAWDVVEEEYNGVKTKSEEITRQAKTILVDGNQFDIARTFPDKMRRMFKGSIAMNTSSTGGQFDWKGTMPGGVEGEMLGQYEVSGDTLRLVYSFQSKNETVSRPTVFSTKGPGAGTVYSVCRRKKIETTVKQLRQFEKALESLQGQWQCVTHAAGGSQWSDQQTKEHDKKLVILGDRFQMTYNQLVDKSKRGIEEGPITRIDSNTNPNQILMIFDTRKPEPILFKGIFELNGDRLRHCYRKCGVDEQGCPYPARFATEKGQAIFDVEYVRVPTK